MHLDAEYGDLVRKLIARLARKRPSPLARGDLRIWAAAAIYAVGGVNFLFDRTQHPHLTGDRLSELTGVPKSDRTQHPHLTGDRLSELTGVPKSTLANKAKVIRDTLRIGPLEPEFCRQELLESNPMAWMISVDGFIVDARTLPPEVQEEARRRGLIPDFPASGTNARGDTRGGGSESHEDREAAGGDPATDARRDGPSMGLAEAVHEVVD